MDGSFGLCLKEITIPSLVEKEVARARISAIVKPDPNHELSDVERSELEAAVEQYTRVALEFAPHEFEHSSRHLEVDAAIEKYGLVCNI